MDGLPPFVQVVKGGDNPSFRYVRRIPSHLVDYFEKPFWKETLGRGTLAEIRARSEKKSAEKARLIAEAEAEQARGIRSASDRKAIATKTAPATVMVVGDSVAANGLLDAVKADRDRFCSDLEDNPVASVDELGSRMSALHRNGELGRSIVALFRADLQSAAGQDFAFAPDFTRDRMREALTSVGLNLDTKTVQLRRLWKPFVSVSIAYVEAAEKVLSDPWHDPAPFEAVILQARKLYRLDGKATVEAAAVTGSLPAPIRSSPVPNAQGPLYSEIFAELIREKEIGGNWTRKTRTKNDVASRHLIGLLGDRPIGSYTKADGREYVAAMKSLPLNWTLQPALRGLTIREAVSFCQKHGGLSMSAKSINDAVITVGAHFIWAMRRYDEVSINPFNGLTMPIKVSTKNQRQPFTLSDLNVIFSAPIYTGCHSLQRWHNPGHYMAIDSAKYWVPLIGLHTGMRLGEICQLHHANIKNDNGIWFFDIVEGQNQSLKSSAAVRVVPIHQQLIDIGFLNFLDRARKNGDARIFPDVLQAKSDDTFSSTFSKQFSHFLTHLEIKHPRIVFHSFRHLMEDAYRNSGVPASIGLPPEKWSSLK